MSFLVAIDEGISRHYRLSVFIVRGHDSPYGWEGLLNCVWHGELLLPDFYWHGDNLMFRARRSITWERVQITARLRRELGCTGSRNSKTRLRRFKANSTQIQPYSRMLPHLFRSALLLGGVGQRLCRTLRSNPILYLRAGPWDAECLPLRLEKSELLLKVKLFGTIYLALLILYKRDFLIEM